MDPMFKLLDEDKLLSLGVNALIARAKEGGPPPYQRHGIAIGGRPVRV
jgi:hypothetical protein